MSSGKSSKPSVKPRTFVSPRDRKPPAVPHRPAVAASADDVKAAPSRIPRSGVRGGRGGRGAARAPRAALGSPQSTPERPLSTPIVFLDLLKNFTGLLVLVRKKDGVGMEGVLATVESSSFVLHNAQKVGTGKIEGFEPVVRISFEDVESLEASFSSHEKTAKEFRTDREISGVSSEGGRDLQKFMVEDDNSSTPEVSEEPWDQFKENSKLGVKSTYTFEKYTTEIDTSDPDYLKNLRKGIEVERAMQGEATTDLHILEERHGIVTETLNEEERYSEVLDSEPAPVTVSLQASSETKEKPPEREGEAVKSLPQQDEITSVPPSDAAESKGTEKDLSKDFVLSTEKKKFVLNPNAPVFLPQVSPAPSSYVVPAHPPMPDLRTRPGGYPMFPPPPFRGPMPVAVPPYAPPSYPRYPPRPYARRT